MDHISFRIAVIAYCAATRASETSGYRTPKHNAAVGGVSNSLHLLGLAADVVYDEPMPDLLFRQAMAHRQGLVLLPEDDHDHLQAGQ